MAMANFIKYLKKFFILICYSSLTFPGCSQPQPEWRKLDDEARKAILSHYVNLVSKCGDNNFISFMGASDKRIFIEFKDYAILPLPQSQVSDLSEAQKLNGIKWLGNVELFCQAFRVHNQDKWSEWIDGSAFPTTFPKIYRTNVTKIDDGYVFENEKEVKYRFVPCADVPK